MSGRDEDNWRDYVAGRLRASDERHDAQESELRDIRNSMGQMALQLQANTTTTNQIKTDTADIREAVIGLKWIGKVAKWFGPVAAAIGVIAALWSNKGGH